MRKLCRVLVTGAGSGVGQGIVKALRIGELPVTVVSGDIAPMNAALYRADEGVLLPKVENVGALGQLISVLRNNRIDVMMIGSEFDLAFVSEHQGAIEKEAGTRVIVAPPATVRIADDKWLTAEFLRTTGLPYAESYLPANLSDALNEASKWGYPIMLKTRRGTSSRHVNFIRDDKALALHYPATPYPMLQRVVDVPKSELDSEYTCSVFKTPQGELLGPFAARRTLRGGTSWHVEVARFPMFDDLLVGIGNALEFVGSLNVQLMVGQNGPIPFELNARFSGTTAIRAHFGFNEPAMALRSVFYGEQLENPTIRRGVAFRYHEEVFVDDIAAADLRPDINRGIVRNWF